LLGVVDVSNWFSISPNNKSQRVVVGVLRNTNNGGKAVYVLYSFIIRVGTVMAIFHFHATALNLMGLDHEKLTYKYLGRRYRLTDVAGKVVQNLIA
jgi:hypothetical protein